MANLETPPTLPAHPVLGSWAEVLADPLGLCGRAFCALGDVVRIRGVAPTSWYLVSHPAGVERVLRANAAAYRAPTSSLAANLFGRGIVLSESDSWLSRTLDAPPLDAQRTATVIAATAGAAELTAERWEVAAREGRSVDMLDEMRQLARTAATAAILSTGAGPEADALGRAMAEALRVLDRRPTTLSTPGIAGTRRNWRSLQARAALDHHLLELIRSRRTSGRARSDLLGALLRARDATTGERMDDSRLRAELFTLLLVGVDTASTALAWCWELLSRHGDALRSVQAEVDEALGPRAPTTPEELARLPFCGAVVDETLRLYPPSWGVPRESVVPDEIAGYRIPAGSLVVLCRWVTHRRGELWDEPGRFDPDRFLGARAPQIPFAYYPFGGTTGGVAAEFAHTICRTALALLARDFDVAAPLGQAMETAPSFTLAPRTPLRLHVARRFAAGAAHDHVGQAAFLMEDDRICVVA